MTSNLESRGKSYECAVFLISGRSEMRFKTHINKDRVPVRTRRFP